MLPKKITLLVKLTVMAVFFVWMSGKVTADSYESRRCVVAMAIMARVYGYNLRNLDTGYLSEGQGALYRATLYAGNDYKFIACSGSSVNDLDLLLFSREGMVARDILSDNKPVLDVTVNSSDQYILVVKMHSGSGSYAMGILYK